ncbi:MULTISPECIES: ABC transporter transmembrane domain-containing protein [Enterococcus]|uniref:ABC transporter transmembrane domain-containing protein n=1 Tax=Enterococcus TaxID=1350 RepID=UPI0010FF92F9|nr:MULTISPECIES: ABC transporter ATP-binding protein [Enterococcus]QCT91776.1 ABC transporter ATP-binding protein [Enterococcus sp. M190262]GMG59374.1 ABC transporter ATP-binding protein [Enterococcus gallinarum]
MTKIIMKEKILVIQFSILSLIASLIGISFAPIIQNFIDAISKKNWEMFYITLCLFFIFLIINFLFHFLSVKSESHLLQKIHISVKSRIIRSILHMNITQYEKSTVGEKINLFNYDLEVFEQYFLDNILQLIQSSFILFFAFGYLLLLSPLVAFVVFFCSVISLIIPSLLGKKIDALTEKTSRLKSNYLNDLKDIFGGFTVIKSFQVEERFEKRNRSFLEQMENNQQKLKNQNGVYNLMMGTLQYFNLIICLCTSGFLVLSNRLSLGEMVAVTQMANMIIQPLQVFGTSVIEIIGSKTIRTKLEKYVDKIDSPTEMPKILDEPFEKLQLKNVSYESEKGITILDNINLIFEKGKKYAIVGKSGSGKTTLLKIIGGLLNCYRGEIIYNGKNLSKSDEIIKASFAHQEPYIFNDNLKNNITLLREQSKKEIERSIRIADLSRVRARQGISKFSENGNSLSGGEKQRISIARLIAGQSNLLLMDEVTSALDYKTGGDILECLLSAVDYTIIFITHDLRENILSSVDEVIFIDNGTVVEQGSYSEILNHDGLFKKLKNS